jgi:K+-sensing histidine kinase KdpD
MSNKARLFRGGAYFQEDNMSEPSGFDFSMLLASSIHDMKNSLGMLLSSLGEMMEEYPAGNEDQHRRYEILQGEASRINNDLVYLLGLYRYENNQLQAREAEVYVEEFIQQQLAYGEPLLSTRSINVEVNCDPDLLWYFDEELLSGLFNNVLVNAIKYTKDKIEISAVEEDGVLKLTLADNGAGFPPPMIAAPEDYHRGIDFGNGSTKLGLYFAAQIARMHSSKGRHGHIQLANQEQGGGVFTVVLP